MKDFAAIAAKLKTAGMVGVIPTDTVYGLVARAADKAAVERLYELKQRTDKPGTLIAAGIEQLEELGLKHRYLKAVEGFWPGPVSVIIPCADPGLAYLHRGKMSLAVRIPAGRELQELLRASGALLTTSANLPGQTPAGTVDQARRYFDAQIDLYIDGGDLSGREPSTIVHVVDDAVEIIRQGAGRIDETGRPEL